MVEHINWVPAEYQVRYPCNLKMKLNVLIKLYGFKHQQKCEGDPLMFGPPCRECRKEPRTLNHINKTPIHNTLSIHLISNLPTMTCWLRNRSAMIAVQRTRMKRSLRCDRATGTSPGACGAGQSMCWSFGTLAPCPLFSTLTTFTSQSKCQFFPATEGILVGSILH